MIERKVPKLCNARPSSLHRRVVVVLHSLCYRNGLFKLNDASEYNIIATAHVFLRLTKRIVDNRYLFLSSNNNMNRMNTLVDEESNDNESIDFADSFESSDFATAWGYGSKSYSGSFFQRTLDDFKRDPNRTLLTKDVTQNRRVFDAEGAAQATADSPLVRKLKGRHLQMIAIGGSIGKTNRTLHMCLLIA